MQFKLSKNVPFLRAITGPMFSGKSQEVDRIATSIYYYNKHQIDTGASDYISYIILRPSLDVRDSKIRELPYSDKIWRFTPVDTLFREYRFNSKLDLLNDYDYIILDEAQFYSASVIPEVKMLLEAGKSVIVSGLDKDYLGEPFSEFIKWAMCVADDVTKLHAICVECGEPSTMAKLTISDSSAPINSHNNVIIEDNNHKYVAMCRKCMYESEK